MLGEKRIIYSCPIIFRNLVYISFLRDFTELRESPSTSVISGFDLPSNAKVAISRLRPESWLMAECTHRIISWVAISSKNESSEGNSSFNCLASSVLNLFRLKISIQIFFAVI